MQKKNNVMATYREELPYEKRLLSNTRPQRTQAGIGVGTTGGVWQQLKQRDESNINMIEGINYTA